MLDSRTKLKDISSECWKSRLEVEQVIRSLSSSRCSSIANTPCEEQLQPYIPIRQHDTRWKWIGQVTTSTSPTLTRILIRNGNSPLNGLVISGTAARPRSEEVCVRILRSASVRATERLVFKAWRSNKGWEWNKKQWSKGIYHSQCVVVVIQCWQSYGR